MTSYSVRAFILVVLLAYAGIVLISAGGYGFYLAIAIFAGFLKFGFDFIKLLRTIIGNPKFPGSLDEDDIESLADQFAGNTGLIWRILTILTGAYLIYAGWFEHRSLLVLGLCLLIADVSVYLLDLVNESES